MTATRMIDISRSISAKTTVYDGDDQPRLTQLCSIGPEAPCNMQVLDNWTTHLLTHVDVPLHFVANGAALHDVPLERFACPAVVVHVDGPVVTQDHIPDEPLEGRAILFRTRNSELDETAPFDREHVYLDEAAAQRLANSSVNLVGIDYLSVDRFGDENYPAHRTLLGSDVLILEGTVLKDVEPGRYWLSALPMRIEGADGSPVRAVLMHEVDRVQ